MEVWHRVATTTRYNSDKWERFPISMEWMLGQVFTCMTTRCTGVITMSPFFGRCWGLVWTSLGKCSNGFNLRDTIEYETTCNLRPTYVQNRYISGWVHKKTTLCSINSSMDVPIVLNHSLTRTYTHTHSLIPAGSVNGALCVSLQCPWTNDQLVWPRDRFGHD